MYNQILAFSDNFTNSAVNIILTNTHQMFQPHKKCLLVDFNHNVTAFFVHEIQTVHTTNVQNSTATYHPLVVKTQQSN